MNQAYPNLLKVRFELDPGDWHGRPSETLWAEPLDPCAPAKALKLRNSPFFALGISFLDVVAATRVPDDYVLEFSGVIDHSGHSTYMILVPVGSLAFDAYWA